jgi:hypothetical protein
MKTIADVPGNATRNALVAACLENEKLFESSKPQFVARLAALRQVMDLNSELLAQFGDAVTEVEHRWERIKMSWPTGSEAADILPVRIASVTQELSRIIYSCGLRTVPERVNRNLAALRIGQPLDFHKTFVDELPEEEQRNKILDFLSRHPKLVDGLVEPATGQIYRISSSERRRTLSFVYFLITLVLPAPFIWAYSRMNIWFPGQGLPGNPPDFARLIAAYIALTVGSLAHMGILALKQMRSGADRSLNALEDWILWFHVKETSIITGVLSMWVALIGLGASSQTAPGTAFFVGYSLDSFVDLFLQRFETGAAKTVEATKAKLLAAGKTE